MALEDDDYVPESEDELYDQSAQTLQDVSDGEIEDFEGSLVQSLIRANARLLAENHEQALDELYDAAYLETAEGEHLDFKVREVGITRKEATPATGVLTFARSSTATSEYIVPRGATATTANGTVSFETTEKGTITDLALFESSSLDSAWQGDTASFGTTTAYANDGNRSLEVGATNGADIFRKDVTIERGDRIEGHVRLGSNNAVGLMLGVEDANNFVEARIDASSGEIGFYDTDGGTTSSINTKAVSVPTATFAKVVVDITMTDEATLTIYDGSDNELDELTVSHDFVSGGLGVVSRDGNSTKHVDTLNRTATTLNAEATEGGEQTNLGADRLVLMPSPPTGVTSVQNPVPTGDPDFRDTDGERLVTGTDRETDEELRGRAIETGSRGGAATVRAIEAALADIDEVIHVEAFENEKLSSNNGLPPLSVEFLVFGGQDADIAQTLHEKVGITERLTSGVNGTSVTYTITDDFLAEDETYEWSEPSTVTVDITVDLVIDGSYEGDRAVKNTLVEYIGGTRTDGGFRSGTDIGEDIRHDAIRDRLVGDELGVVGISNIELDKDGDGTDDSTTNGNGLTVLSVPASEVAQTDATDGSITINTTEV